MNKLKEIERELYAALHAFHEITCGGNASVSAGKLGISKNIFTKAKFMVDPSMKRIDGFSEKTVQKCLENGDARLVAAAADWLDFKRETAPGSRRNDFCFLYGGMQQILITDCRLLNAVIASRPSDELELIEASGLLYGFLYGQYLYAMGTYGDRMPIFPVTPGDEATGNLWDEFAGSILQLARSHPDDLFVYLVNLITFNTVPDHRAPDADGCIVEGLRLATATYYTAGRLRMEAAANPALKKRPLGVLAKALFDLLHSKLPDMRAATTGAFGRLEIVDAEAFEDLIKRLRYTEYLVTGNRQLAWAGQSVFVVLNSKGIYMQRLSERTPTRIEKSCMDIPGITPDDSHSITWSIDTDIYNVTMVKHDLPSPYQNTRLIIEHKLLEYSITDLIPEDYLERCE